MSLMNRRWTRRMEIVLSYGLPVLGNPRDDHRVVASTCSRETVISSYGGASAVRNRRNTTRGTERNQPMISARLIGVRLSVGFSVSPYHSSNTSPTTLAPGIGMA